MPRAVRRPLCWGQAVAAAQMAAQPRGHHLTGGHGSADSSWLLLARHFNQTDRPLRLVWRVGT